MDRKYILCDIGIMLMACYVGLEGNPLYELTDHEEDAILSQSEKLLQHKTGNVVYIILCVNLRARTGTEQTNLKDLSRIWNMFKINLFNNTGKQLLELLYTSDINIVNGACKDDIELRYNLTLI